MHTFTFAQSLSSGKSLCKWHYQFGFFCFTQCFSAILTKWHPQTPTASSWHIPGCTTSFSIVLWKHCSGRLQHSFPLFQTLWTENVQNRELHFRTNVPTTLRESKAKRHTAWIRPVCSRWNSPLALCSLCAIWSCLLEATIASWALFFNIGVPWDTMVWTLFSPQVKKEIKSWTFISHPTIVETTDSHNFI